MRDFGSNGCSADVETDAAGMTGPASQLRNFPGSGNDQMLTRQRMLAMIPFSQPGKRNCGLGRPAKYKTLPGRLLHWYRLRNSAHDHLPVSVGGKGWTGNLHTLSRITQAF